MIAMDNEEAMRETVPYFLLSMSKLAVEEGSQAGQRLDSKLVLVAWSNQTMAGCQALQQNYTHQCVHDLEHKASNQSLGFHSNGFNALGWVGVWCWGVGVWGPCWWGAASSGSPCTGAALPPRNIATMALGLTCMVIPGREIYCLIAGGAMKTGDVWLGVHRLLSGPKATWIAEAVQAQCICQAAGCT